MKLPELVARLRGQGYELGPLLGQGASGKVFRARCERSSAEVAIKVIRGEGGGTDPEHRRILVANETTLSWKLFHPYLITVFETFADNEYDYVVMEYVDGGDLQPYSAPAARLPVEEVLEIARKCCIALGYASRCGVVHRDIQPANILRAARGEIRITDFGGAIFRNLDKSAIANFGSPAYMSPEQVRGDNLDSRSDMFSLGVVLFQLLTGTLPFDAPDSQAVSFKILYTDAPKIESLRSDLPEGLVSAVNRALAKLPSDRFAGWEAFGAALSPRKPVQPGETLGDVATEALRAMGVSLFEGLEQIELRRVAKAFRTWSAGDVTVFQPGQAEIAFVIDGRVDIATRDGGFCAGRGDLVWICGVQPQGALPGGFRPEGNARIGILSLLELCDNPDLLGKLMPRLASYLSTQARRGARSADGAAGLNESLAAARDQLIRVVGQIDECIKK